MSTCVYTFIGLGLTRASFAAANAMLCKFKGKCPYIPVYISVYIYICIETLRSVWVELYINICIQIYIYIRIIRQEQIGLQCIPSQALRWQVYRPCSLAPAENWLEEKAYHVGNLLGFLWYVLKMVCRQRLYIYIHMHMYDDDLKKNTLFLQHP